MIDPTVLLVTAWEILAERLKDVKADKEKYDYKEITGIIKQLHEEGVLIPAAKSDAANKAAAEAESLVLRGDFSGPQRRKA